MDETNDYSHFAESHAIQKELGTLSTHDDFSILLGVLSAYIDDLETKKHKVRSNQDYSNFFKKPSTKKLIDAINYIVKKYKIKNTTKALKDFRKALGGLHDND